MLATPKTLKGTHLLRRAFSIPEPKSVVVSNPQPRVEGNAVKQQPILHRMSSDTSGKPEPVAEQLLSNLDSHLDDLFSKIAQLNLQLDGQPTVPVKSQPTLSKQESARKRKISFELHPIQPATQPSPPTKHELSMKDFHLGNPLGQGKFGEVVQLIHRQTGMLFAVKKILKSIVQEYQMHEQVLQEIRCLRQLSHPNIVKLYGAFTDEYHVFLLTEYVHGETIEKYYGSEGSLVSRLVYQVLKAVEYMHANYVVHRDIKPENVIYSHGVVKLCDFGWATSFKNQLPNDFCGTLDYVSPEVVEKKPYDGSVDMWSIGILTFQLLTGRVPFKDANKQVHLSNIAKCDPSQIHYPAWLKPEATDFIGRLLKKIPTLRMTVKEAIRHPFITQHQKTEYIPNDIGDVVHA